MNQFINIVVGWLAFGSVVVLARTGPMLQSRASLADVAARDHLFIGLVVGSIFFLQYAVERYLMPPHAFTGEQRKRLRKGAEGFYRKTFFRGAIGISYFFLVLYAIDYLHPLSFAPHRIKNWMAYSVFFLILGLLARARGIILHLSGQSVLPP
jgi:hypothetical protein